MLFETLQMWDSASFMTSAVQSTCCKYLLWLLSSELDPVLDVHRQIFSEDWGGGGLGGDSMSNGEQKKLMGF